MDTVLFSGVLERAFSEAASAHGQSYGPGAAAAWGIVGATYLAFALCGLSSTRLRSVQYQARDEAGPVILDCKWYDGLVKECLGGQEEADALLPGPDDNLHTCTVTRELFLEMLDFLREG